MEFFLEIDGNRDTEDGNEGLDDLAVFDIEVNFGAVDLSFGELGGFFEIVSVGFVLKFGFFVGVAADAIAVKSEFFDPVSTDETQLHVVVVFEHDGKEEEFSLIEMLGIDDVTEEIGVVGDRFEAAGETM